MSCFRPITINNPSLVKNNVFNRSRLEVPCGHCENCKDVKRMSWYVRLYYEWQFCEDKGGFSLYETLTYNNAHLPFIFDYFDGEKIVKQYSCFSVRDVQLYLKKVRKRLKKIFGRVIDFRYFLSMEYGGTTHRPHYHILFFVADRSVSPFIFKKVVEDTWACDYKYLSNGCRDYDIGFGFVKAGKINNGFVSNTGALSYAAKYVAKDVYEDKFVMSLSRDLEKHGFSREQYKAIFPRVLCSKNLGIYALEFDKNNDLDNFMSGDIMLPDKDLLIRKFKLPLYYERKLFYNVCYRYFDCDCNDYVSVAELSQVPDGVDFSPIYVLNDLGLEMKSFRAEKSLKAVRNVYRVVQSIPDACDVLDKLNSKFNTSFASLGEFQQFIRKELPEDIFISYSLVYRGCKTSYKCDCVSSPCGSTPYYDYMLINDMSRGSRPLSVDFSNLCDNIDNYNYISNIEDNYAMIRYVFYLVSLALEKDKIRKDYDYVMNKSAYLAATEV